MKKCNSAIIAANNHYAGFGPMSANLFAEMMNLKNHVRTFPIIDYKIPASSNKSSIFENDDIYNKNFNNICLSFFKK